MTPSLCTVSTILLVFGAAQLVLSQESLKANDESPCFDDDGSPLRCAPTFGNMAYGADVSVTNHY